MALFRPITKYKDSRYLVPALGMEAKKATIEIVVRSGLFDLSVYGLEVGFGFKIPTFACVDFN
jgi:hypothetical protein